MDRNLADEKIGKMLDVATREGGVDRNDKWEAAYTKTDTSPPARVAWIETLRRERQPFRQLSVATREGGVDRETVSSALFRPLPNVIARKVWRR